MKIEALIDRMNGRLTPADRKIAEVLLALGSEAAFLSAHELSRRTGTHAATAVRFARKLGYAGYPEFLTGPRRSPASPRRKCCGRRLSTR